MKTNKLLDLMSNFSKWSKIVTSRAQTKFITYKSKSILNGLMNDQGNVHGVYVNSNSKLNGDIENNGSKSKNYLHSKFNELVIWYEQVSGMDEVRIAQKRVIDAQERLILAQERRREANKQLSLIHSQLKDIYADLDTTTRGEERYLQLITKEHKLLKEEKKLVEDFNLSEQEERNSFTVLSSSVKDSHEKERAQAEKTKYWSLIGSIFGTVIGIIGSSINNEFKMKELRKIIKESTMSRQSSDEASTILHKLENRLTNLMASSNANKSHENPINFRSNSASVSEDLEALIQQQRLETKVVLATASVIAIVIPIIISLVNR